ncbi:CGNR zinc finger domain-containing protein [Pseudomonas sp. 15A4]|jgi:predicted RNA-binding Zn ribbon-like protein|uniref:CGNR zinc finger domain-containing protein n=1 Tax=Pseudomonas sp. 15A4 TaxID=2804761 RepID=UPI000F02AD3B|nr:CGNR zinc finger domain-containing protein [Pseudomonas sp. 15A4]QSB19062.1 CGNR zinc finger domain-containing protein [Pseudomonas sp. 15A4]
MSIGQLKINAIRLVGGSAVLDYLNTCDGRRPGTGLLEVVDKLGNLEDIVHWFRHADLIDDLEHQHFVAVVRRSSWHTVTAFEQLIDFREALYRLLLPMALDHSADQVSLDALNQALADTADQRLLVLTPAGVIWRWRVGDDLGSMTAGFIGRLAVQASELLTSGDLSRLRACATPDCDWLFLDTSKNGRRRWCQMNVCGAREKVKRAMAAS